MNILKLAGANIADGGGNQSLYDIINGLGLTTNLKLCLDAGDDASYDPAVQTNKWLDTSGQGTDFFRGSGTGSQSSDPTFNGSAGGLSSSEYWSYDGGDWFTYDTTIETWMNNLHKDNAIMSAIIVFYPVSGATERHFSTRVGGQTGFLLAKASTNVSQLIVYNGASIVLGLTSTGTVTNSSWNVIGYSLNEATGANGALIKINGNSAEQFTSTYSSPSSSNLSISPVLGAAVNGVTPNPNGSRIACIAIWEGTALTSTNLSDIYDGIKGRFGL